MDGANLHRVGVTRRFVQFCQSVMFVKLANQQMQVMLICCQSIGITNVHGGNAAATRQIGNFSSRLCYYTQITPDINLIYTLYWLWWYRASLERWLDHLRKSLPMDSRGNSSDHFRGRAATENHKLRGRHSRTPRDNAEVQSVHYPERTIISPPTNAQNLMVRCYMFFTNVYINISICLWSCRKKLRVKTDLSWLMQSLQSEHV